MKSNNHSRGYSLANRAYFSIEKINVTLKPSWADQSVKIRTLGVTLRRAGYFKLVEKSRAACVAAIETYNRASCQYREESFSILMINAWELLLKARIMQANNGKVSSLHEFRQKKRKDGTPSKFKELKTTKSGSPMTIGLEKCCNLVAGYPVNRIDQHCLKNIEALVDIRDSATHFVNNNPLLQQALVEISLASVKNYVISIQKWFSVSFSDLNIASIPISFNLDQNEVEAIAKKSPDAVIKFLAHMKASEVGLASISSDYSFSVKVQFDLIKSKADDAVKASIVNVDPDLTLIVEDGKVPPAYAWDYNTLCGKLRKRYSNFIINSTYHTLRKTLEKDTKLCLKRYLDPSKKGSSSKNFYNPNIIKNFDQHYTKKEDDLFSHQDD
ncbi:DUF3644 domain-containing protein [Agrobacterium sp. BA1120]|uniref:DUF3644 domain-containing protein n=1 Tax=Agrobacterium sp. BA1120 TaxID=3228927 RepID=UPI00336A86E2